MKLRTVKGLYLVGLGVGLIITIIGGTVFHNETVIWIGGGIMLAGIVFHLIFYRCPHCRTYLFRNNGEFCQHCGKALFDDEE